MSATIIVDCGTTNLRCMLLGGDGRVLARGSRSGGVRHTAIDGHNGRLKAMLAECMEEVLQKAGLQMGDVSRCVAFGMITSNVGLLEIPHLIAPVSAEDLRRGMRTERFLQIAPFEIAFIPGVRNFAGSVTLENCSGMDMMRGEETESIGLYDLLRPQQESVFILPGSHNKFVRVSAKGEILGCMTSISGELLDAVTHGTILADAVGRAFATEEDYDAEMACRGAMECLRCGLGRSAFAGRILNQLGGVESVRLRSYLLGAVLAQDALALQAFIPDVSSVKVYIAGKMPLQRAIRDVLGAMGIEDAEQVPSEISGKMGLHGAMKIAGV